MSGTPSYDEARRMLKQGGDFINADVKLMVISNLAVAESLMAIEGLLRAQDARARREIRAESSEEV